MSDLEQTIAAMPPAQVRRLLARSGLPPHLSSGPGAPPPVTAAELVQWFRARDALDALRALIAETTRSPA